MSGWTFSNIPDLTGKRTIVTGGNVGLGFKSALELARKGAEVIIACRRPESGGQAIARIYQELPAAKLSCLPLDLTDLTSVTRFADTFVSCHDRLDILLNNAGVVNLETLRHTGQGHEMHMATNHYGHFALTAHLFPLLLQTGNARVVTVTSGAYRVGEIRFDDMDWNERHYSRTKAYGDSKLANLLFTYALQTRFDLAGANALSLAAHPGLAATERQQSIGIGGRLSKWLAASVETGAAPQLRAATDPAAGKGDFYGPRFGIRGPASKIKVKRKALDNALAEELWAYTENLTGCRFETRG
ncbi:oxidoreductase [Roseibium sp. SCP14]|uniref:oxidoreductase n=1 Tax=Roseibium sp. SCP14 TaxID=3141375 RepID=UPI0033360A6D